jgi:hypothetical protein
MDILLLVGTHILAFIAGALCFHLPFAKASEIKAVDAPAASVTGLEMADAVRPVVSSVAPTPVAPSTPAPHMITNPSPSVTIPVAGSKVTGNRAQRLEAGAVAKMREVEAVADHAARTLVPRKRRPIVVKK